MGLADILSNPGIIGLAMAGLSRDPEAPYRTFGVMQGANDMARQAQVDEEKKLQRADTLKALEAMYGNQQGQENALVNALSRFQGAQAMPEKTIAAPPLGGAPEAMPQLEDNKERIAETKAALAEIKQVAHPAEAAFRISDYPNANPEVLAAGMAKQYNLKLEAAKWLMQEAREEKKAKQQFEFKKEEIALKGEEDRKTNAAKGTTEKMVNMDPNYDAVGTQVLGAEYHTPQGQRKFAEMYKNDPAVRKLVDEKIARDAKNKFQGFAPIINYLPTSEGYVPVPVRGLPAGGEIGKPMGIGKPIPSEQVSKLADLETLKKQISDVKGGGTPENPGLFKSEYVGPVSGRMGTLKEKLVDIPENQVKFYATVKDMKDALLRARSGAQINEQEYKRLVGFLPDENLPTKNFKARLDRFENAVDQIISSKRSQLSTSGYGTPGQKQEVQAAPKQGQPQAQSGGKPKTWEQLKQKYQRQ